MQRRNTIRIILIAALIGSLLTAFVHPVYADTETLSVNVFGSQVPTSNPTASGEPITVTVSGRFSTGPGDPAAFDSWGTSDGATDWQSYDDGAGCPDTLVFQYSKDNGGSWNNFYPASYNTSHIYSFTDTGNGQVWQFRWLDCFYSNNQGGPLTVEVSSVLVGQPPAFDENALLSCPLMGMDTATFANLNNWHLEDGASHPDGETSTLKLLNPGSASLQLSLSPFHQYEIEIHYANLGESDVAGRFHFGLGSDNRTEIETRPGEADYYVAPPANYVPGTPDSQVGESVRTSGASFFEFKIGRDSTDLGNFSEDTSTIIISSVCIRDTSDTNGDGTGVTSRSAAVDPSCSVGCDFSYTATAGDNFVQTGLNVLIGYLHGLFNYLLCGLLKWFNCTLRPALGGIWTTIENILGFISLFLQWIGRVISALANWGSGIGHNASDWLNSVISNVITSILNAIVSLMNSLGLTHIVNAALQFLQGIFGGNGFFGQIFTFIGSIWSLILAIIQFIATTLVNLVVAAVNAIVSLFSAIISIFNVAPSAPPGVPACDTSASMIPESCVGLFIIDNTVLVDGGLLWTVIPLIEAAAGIGVIWWAINDIKKALVGNEDE